MAWRCRAVIPFISYPGFDQVQQGRYVMAPCNSTRSVLASDAESLAARLEEQGVLRAGKVKCVGKVLPFEVPVQVLCWSTTGGRQVPDLGRHERELASWWARDGGSLLSQSRLLPPASCHLPPATVPRPAHGMAAHCRRAVRASGQERQRAGGAASWNPPWILWLVYRPDWATRR